MLRARGERSRKWEDKADEGRVWRRLDEKEEQRAGGGTR